MTNRSLQLIVESQDPLTLGPGASIQEACTQMWERRVGATLVVSGEKLVGIFTGRDAVRILAEGRDPVHTTLAAVMTRNPDSLPSTAHAIDALNQMRDCGYRHIPVVDGEKLVGIVSRSDFEGRELDLFEEETTLWERTA